MQGSNMVYVVFVLLLAIITAIVAAPTESKTSHKWKKDQWKKHMTLVHKFKCGVPQPRTVTVEEILGHSMGTEEAYHPPVTVLHRCDAGSGCCAAEDESCGPLDDGEQVDIVFFVTKNGGAGNYVTLSARNHTVCGCTSNVVDGPK